MQQLPHLRFQAFLSFIFCTIYHQFAPFLFKILEINMGFPRINKLYFWSNNVSRFIFCSSQNVTLLHIFPFLTTKTTLSILLSLDFLRHHVSTYKWFTFLDEALSSQVVWCGYKQVNTRSIRRKFSTSVKIEESGLESSNLIVPDLSTSLEFQPPPDLFNQENTWPSWIKGVAKLLESGFDGDDWRALAKLLGYKAEM